MNTNIIKKSNHKAPGLLILKMLIVFVCATSVIITKNTDESRILLSVLLIFVSISNMFFTKKNKGLLILFSIICYINISFLFPGVINKGLNLAYYQLQLWNSEYCIEYVKAILVANATFSVFFIGIADNSAPYYKESDFKKYYNPLLSCLSFGILLVIFVFCFDGTSSSNGGIYASNNNSFYEYAIFFFSLAWIFGCKNKALRIIWYLFALYYILNGLFSGDRSSCFMLAALIVIYKWKNSSFLKILFFAFIGILAANLIAGLRNISSISLSNIGTIFGEQTMNSLFSDTAIYSFYAGITIVYYGSVFSGSKILLLVKWIISMFLGGFLFSSNDYELVGAARSVMYNGGGGMFSSFFYFYGGLFGVAIGAILASLLIRKIYTSNKTIFSQSLKYIIPAMCLRWYLYSPTSLFRTCFINYGIICIGFMLLDNSLKMNKRLVTIHE